MKKTIIAIVVLVIVGFGIYAVSNNGSTPAPAAAPSVPAAPVAGTAPAAEQPAAKQPAQPTSILNSTPKTGTAEAAASNTSSVNVPAVASVLINNFAFSPLTLTVKKGTTVTWTNNDGAPHNVTSDTGTLLKSPTLSTGQAWSFTFAAAGTFSYHCSIHPMMKATVVVQN